MTQNGPPKKDSEFLPNSAIETQKTQKLGVFAEILPPLESLLYCTDDGGGVFSFCPLSIYFGPQVLNMAGKL